MMQSNERISLQEQQQIAEQFLTTQYAEALHYFTLSKVTEREDRTRFTFEQFVGGYPLARFYCIIEIAANGQVLDFNYKAIQRTRLVSLKNWCQRNPSYPSYWRRIGHLPCKHKKGTD